MKELLEKCDKLYKSDKSCPEGKSINCPQCVQEGFYGESDDYFCPRKHYYYVLNYGPSYASEIYNYLRHSKILENNFKGKKIKVLSLGCGFAPDLMALNKYINDKKLSIKISYTGIDESDIWPKIRLKFDNAVFKKKDVTIGFDLTDYDIVFIVKLFSTLNKRKLDNAFLDILGNEIENNLKNDAFLFFVDVNNRNMGRDKFDSFVSNRFSSCKHYYFDVRNPYKNGYREIPYTKVVFEVSDEISFSPQQYVNKTVVFEYKK